ncbi:HAMP domain/GAF domain/HD domain protein [Labilithrix luteola]|uniref:HAMP domain/GAF domain/HD domain protein n=1 Tax=Labilithrix luteola TaxID=1391654 RepID=A0A0K1QGH2_9BACT|nr:response regulator [Labilithrix luteola]AKV04535.1 HAMP domain/GAF domain/HD domain protein [Labilithrix luteola]
MTIAPERRPLVLVVDDDDDHNLVMTMSLEALGYEVRAADSCAAAHAVAASENVDALLSDLSLGDGNALDLVRGLATRPRVAIVLTGFDDVGAAVRGAFDAVLLKPATIDRVDEILRRALTDRREPTPPSEPGVDGASSDPSRRRGAA